jgi:transcriptional regulator with XRE-family HTH domain
LSRPKRAPLQKALVQLRKRMGHTQESFSRVLGVSLPTLGNWEASGRLPLDIMLARLEKIARDNNHIDLADTFHAGLEELKMDRAAKAADIFDEIARWHEIKGHLTAVSQIAAAVREATSLKEAKTAVEPINDLLVEFEKTLSQVQAWSWRNR